MITIYRQNECVVVAVDSTLPYKCTGTDETIFTFKHRTAAPWIAELLASYLTKQLEDRLAEIRKAAYEAGWKDAKSKRRKKQEMLTSWQASAVGY